MGLLDDAIREHLDLKRRRGADPTEIERAEREALGPVRRGPEEQQQVEPSLEEALAYDHEGDQEDWDERFEDHAGDFAGEPFAPGEPAIVEGSGFAPEPAAPPPPSGTAQHQDFESPLEFKDPFAETHGAATPTPHPAAAPPQPPPGEHVGQETEEYEVEALHEEDEKPADDVLEETPEFLQDTPDHDRLWFEQRPPRDFDFEG
jgi:hypothetical protein